MDALERFTAELYGLGSFSHDLGEREITSVPKSRRASAIGCERVFFEAVRSLDVDWIWEAGCFDGRHTRRFLSETDACVFAFEPNPYCYPKLADLIPLARFDLCAMALSDAQGVHEFLLPRKIAGIETGAASGVSGLDHRDAVTSYETCFVATGRGRDVQPDLGVQALWLDVEGHALPALRGFGDTLLRFSFIMVETEYADLFSDGANTDGVFALMAEHGFAPRYRDFVNTGQCNVIFVRESVEFAPPLKAAHDITDGLGRVLRLREPSQTGNVESQ